MFIKKFAVHAFALFTGLATAEAQPALFPSRLCVHTNESVFIIGNGLKPGEEIQGFLVSSHYRSPLWILYADTNGNLRANITYRGNLNMQGPRAVQEYQFVGESTNAAFHLWYQTYNPSNDWKATITGIDTYMLPSSNRQVTVYATIVPYNNYQVEMASDLSGPWHFIGEVSTSESSDSQTEFGTQIGPVDAAAPRQFFRFGDPYLPCPCDF